MIVEALMNFPDIFQSKLCYDAQKVMKNLHSS